MRHVRRGVYWEIPICASAFLGEEVVVIQKIKCPNHECGRRIFDVEEMPPGRTVLDSPQYIKKR